MRAEDALRDHAAQLVAEPLAHGVDHVIAQMLADALAQRLDHLLTHGIGHAHTHALDRPLLPSAAERRALRKQRAQRLAEVLAQRLAEALTQRVADPLAQPFADARAHRLDDAIADLIERRVARLPAHPRTACRLVRAAELWRQPAHRVHRVANRFVETIELVRLHIVDHWILPHLHLGLCCCAQARAVATFGGRANRTRMRPRSTSTRGSPNVARGSAIVRRNGPRGISAR